MMKTFPMKICMLINILILTSFNPSISEEIKEGLPYSIWDEKELKKIVKKYEEHGVEKSSQTLKSLGIAYHNLGALGNRGMAKHSVNYLEECYKEIPEDMETLVYLGSAKTMLGRDAVNPINKIRYVMNGAKLIDKAVKNDPENVVIRMVRINNSKALPGFFGRYKYVNEDLDFLFELIKKKPLIFSPDLLSNIYYLKGETFKDQKKIIQAREYWEKAASISSESFFGVKAIERLEMYTESE